eukprot:TRINITY_DN3967_c0_g2_i1.p1 TRINITY_DN3967_c0_g2~~TRINITY_DN3967_c0_g2_i1.p1  ORF type:complete len:995 (-),score=173.70 TRINITY_DN3967_c0_g2_i1:146-3130(-)
MAMAQHIEPGVHAVALNAPEVHVSGEGLPSSCPGDITLLSGDASDGTATLILGTDYSLSSCGPEGFTVLLSEGKTWQPPGVEPVVLRLTRYGGLTDMDVVVGTLVSAFAGYLHPRTDPIPNTQTTITLHGWALQPAGVSPQDIDLQFVAPDGGCNVQGPVVGLNDTAITATLHGIHCAAPGPLRVLLVTAGKPAEKLPEWPEVDNTMSHRRRVSPAARATGGGAEYDRHLNKQVVVGTITAPMPWRSVQALALNAPELIISGTSFPPTGCEPARDGEGLPIWNHAHAVELRAPAGAPLEMAGASCDFRTRSDGDSLCAWYQPVADSFDWAVMSGPSSPRLPDTIDSMHNRRESRYRTGPEHDANGDGNYLAIDASPPRVNGDVASLVSPEFVVHNLTTAIVFQYHMLGESTGTLSLEVLPQGGSWLQLWSRTGDQTAYCAEPHCVHDWTVATVELVDWMHQSIQLRFNATVGDGSSGNIAVDDIRVHASDQLTPVEGQCCGVANHGSGVGLGPLLNQDYVLAACSTTGITLRLLAGGRWGLLAGGPLMLTRYASSGAISVQVATLIPEFDGVLFSSPHCSTQEPQCTGGIQIAPGSAEVAVHGSSLRPVGCSEGDVIVLLHASHGRSPTGRIKPGSWEQDRVVIELDDFQNALPGQLQVALEVAGRQTNWVAAATVVPAMRILEHRGNLGLDAAMLHVQGSALPLACPEAEEHVQISGLRMYHDFLLANCSTDGFTLVLLPGMRFGRKLGPLRVLRYADTGPIHVTVADLVPGGSPTVTMEQPALLNTATTVTIRGVGLRPFGATRDHVHVQFYPACGDAPSGAVTPASVYDNGLIKVAVSGLNQTCAGPLLARIVVRGIDSGAPVAVASVVSPTLDASSHRLAANGAALLVTGHDLPVMCPTAPEHIQVGGLSPGAESRAMLTLGTDFTLSGCTATGFVMNLAKGRRWHPRTGELRVSRYSTSGAIDVTVAKILPLFNGELCLLYTSPSPRDS